MEPAGGEFDDSYEFASEEFLQQIDALSPPTGGKGTAKKIL